MSAFGDYLLDEYDNEKVFLYHPYYTYRDVWHSGNNLTRVFPRKELLLFSKDFVRCLDTFYMTEH